VSRRGWTANCRSRRRPTCHGSSRRTRGREAGAGVGHGPGLAGCREAPQSLPESREFYWSKLQRALEGTGTGATATDGGPVPSLRWLRWLLPAGLAAALALVLYTAKPPPPQNAGLTSTEIDSPQEDWGTITFRSDREQMTVVWIGNP